MEMKINKNIKDIKKGDKNINIIVILIEYLSKTSVKNGKHITHYLIADKTGSIQCNFFDEIGDKIQEGDILYITGAYASLFKHHLVLYNAKPGFGQVIKFDEFFMSFSKTPNLSEKLYDEFEQKDDNKDNNQYHN